MPSTPHSDALHKPYYGHLRLMEMPSILVYKAPSP